MICTSCGKQYKDSTWERDSNGSNNVVNEEAVHLCEDCYCELYAILNEPLGQDMFDGDLEE